MGSVQNTELLQTAVGPVSSCLLYMFLDCFNCTGNFSDWDGKLCESGIYGKISVQW